MGTSTANQDLERTALYADRFAALGAEPRLRIVRLLLAAHPQGLVVREVQKALHLTPSTLSHHLEKLKNDDLVTVSREGTFLRYRANVRALQDVLQFLYAECCSKSRNTRTGKMRICP
ncbi:MAG TPA: metalloregulator ArsR/SmtB family transcription factor [Bryobacteraceae bacterium]|nr:metalloregulator ArsR/SmtB family transcription factor [Bryobacteraceae bacterium]